MRAWKLGQKVKTQHFFSTYSVQGTLPDVKLQTKIKTVCWAFHILYDLVGRTMKTQIIIIPQCNGYTVDGHGGGTEGYQII